MEVAVQLSNWQLAVLVIMPALVSIAGFLNNGNRIGDLKADVLHLNGRLDQLIGAVNELDKRTAVIEDRLKID